MIKALATFLFSVCFLAVSGQPIPLEENRTPYPFINTIFNRVLNQSGLDSFYQKLYELKKNNSGTVSIVHIGDSHIQADFLSGQVRQNFQSFFGDAGRGLVFPYQLAASNAPGDIMASSNKKWMGNRLAQAEIRIPVGISGFVIRTGTEDAGFSLSLRPDFTSGLKNFNRMKFFTDTIPGNGWILESDLDETPYIIRRDSADTGLYQELVLARAGTGFRIQSLPGSSFREFFGVSLENSKPGVLYHSIGVNGARYDQYNSAGLFWRQLPALQADLYIVSLGTNEAQRAAFAETVFLREFNLFIGKLRETSPGAAILISTAPDSYKGRYSNRVLKALNESLIKETNRLYLPSWDLYKITNGFGSAYSWSRRGLMSRDRVHFTAEGYRLQGRLLFNALAKGYNDYLELRSPGKTP